jgi:hypothetical protein
MTIKGKEIMSTLGWFDTEYDEIESIMLADGYLPCLYQGVQHNSTLIELVQKKMARFFNIESDKPSFANPLPDEWETYFFQVGEYDANLAGVIKGYQMEMKIKIDGSIGPQTWRAMGYDSAADCPKKASTVSSAVVPTPVPLASPFYKNRKYQIAAGAVLLSGLIWFFLKDDE